MQNQSYTLEQQAIASIAAEMKISVVFLRGDAVTILPAADILCCDDIFNAVASLASLAFGPPSPVLQIALPQLIKNGCLKIRRGVVVLLAGTYVLPTAPENLHQWAAAMAEAWQGLVTDHVSMLNSAGTVADQMSRTAYLSKRFDTDEANLWMLAEGASAVAVACGKLGRRGYDHGHQKTGESGMCRLESSVGDFLAAVDIMIARGHFTAEALEAAKLAKLECLEKCYEVARTPADTAPVTPSLTARSAKELIEGGYLARPVVADTATTGPKTFAEVMSEFRKRRTKALPPTAPVTTREAANSSHHWKEIATTLGELSGAKSFGWAAGATLGGKHVSPPVPAADVAEKLPRTPEGNIDWKALEGDHITIKKGAGGLLIVEVTNNGRLKLYTGVAATLNINNHLL